MYSNTLSRRARQCISSRRHRWRTRLMDISHIRGISSLIWTWFRLVSLRLRFLQRLLLLLRAEEGRASLVWVLETTLQQCNLRPWLKPMPTQTRRPMSIMLKQWKQRTRLDNLYRQLVSRAAAQTMQLISLSRIPRVHQLPSPTSQ